MAIHVQKARGLSQEEAVLEATSNGLIVLVQNSEEGETEDAHWHRWDTHLYVIDGEYRNLDPANPELVLESGDYCLVPKETIHAAHTAKAGTLVIGVTPEILSGVTIQEDPAELA